MEVKLYTTHCPKCNVLEKKLESKKISFAVSEDIDEMLKKGIVSAPYLEVSGELMNYQQAIEWVNKEA